MLNPIDEYNKTPHKLKKSKKLKSEFHSFAIKTIIAAFFLPIFLFVLLLKTKLSPIFSLFISIIIFCLLMGHVLRKALQIYAIEKPKNKMY